MPYSTKASLFVNMARKYKKRSKRRRRAKRSRRGTINPVRGIPNAELKYNDVSAANTVSGAAVNTFITLAGAGGWDPAANPPGVTTLLLNGIQEGSDNTHRVGRTLVMKSVLIRFMIRQTTTTPALNQNGTVRMLLIYDAMNNGGAAPAITVPLAENSLASLNLLDNRSRFRVLLDKYFTMDDGKGTIVNYKKFKRLNLPTIYKATGGDIGDINVGSLLLYIQSDLVVAPFAQLRTRVRYRDE